jgi:CBS domain-containing protein
MRIKEIMKETVTVSPNISIKDAARKMAEEDIGSLVVVDGNKAVGILTERDIIRNISNIKEKISKIMSEQVVAIEEDEDIDNAAELMAKNKIKHLPVTKGAEVVGIVTTTDLIRHCEDLNEDFFLD